MISSRGFARKAELWMAVSRRIKSSINKGMVLCTCRKEYSSVPDSHRPPAACWPSQISPRRATNVQRPLPTYASDIADRPSCTALLRAARGFEPFS